MENLEEVKKAAEQNIIEVATKAATQAVEETNKSIEGLQATLSAKEEVIKSLEAKIEEVSEIATKASAEVKKQGQKTENSQKVQTFNEYLEEAIKSNIDSIQSYKAGGPEVTIAMKAVGDMSIATNFPGATPFIQDVRQNLILNTYNKVWLSDILPQGTSTGNSVLFPKENGGEGGVAPWINPAVDKSQVDFDFSSQAAYFKWLAGYVVVDREMLDDIPFLISYLQSKLLVSYKTAENNFILNGTTDTNPVTGLLTAATAYNGTLDTPVDRVIDAAWGQIVEDTFEFYQPTNVLLTPRKAVNLGLNKAAGSGEYDLPNGSMAFSRGKLELGGLEVVTTSSIPSTDFLALDANAAMYITRLNPEIRMFEDAALAKRNKIMFRIEGRSTLAIFNNKAIVKGTLEAPSAG